MGHHQENARDAIPRHIMSTRTTITLDDDVLEKLNHESSRRGASLRETVNDLLRYALIHRSTASAPPTLKIRPFPMGYKPGLNYDSVQELLDYGEGIERNA
jgi:hypothetical protein